MINYFSLRMSFKNLSRNLTPNELEACGHKHIPGLGYIHRSRLPR